MWAEVAGQSSPILGGAPCQPSCCLFVTLEGTVIFPTYVGVLMGEYTLQLVLELHMVVHKIVLTFGHLSPASPNRAFWDSSLD